MIKGLSEYDKLLVVRPVIGGCEIDDQDMPIIRNSIGDAVDWESLTITGVKNLSKKNPHSDTLIHMFSYDKELMALWNHPLKKIPQFRTYAAVATPDFSAYKSMNLNQIRHNVFMSRWLGCTWQNYGCKVIPTIGWADKRSFDVCFSGVERGAPVIISTLGCTQNVGDFMAGFVEMKKRISPALIIVYGKMLSGMTGRFLHFAYQDAFATGSRQLRMACVPQIVVVEGVA